MVPIFQIPQSINELEDISTEENVFRVRNVSKLDVNDVQSLQRLLEGVRSKVLRRGGIETITENDTFSIFYVFTRSFSRLPPQVKTQFLDILGQSVRAACSLFKIAQDDDAEKDMDSTRIRSNALKMATFLLFTVISTAETSHVAEKNSEGPKKRGKTKSSRDDDDEDIHFDWTSYRENATTSLASVLDVDMSKVWNMGVPDELFINLFCRIAYQLLGQPINGRGAVEFRNTVMKLIAVPLRLVSSMENTVIAQMIHLLHNNEHCSSSMAQLCKVSSVVSGDSRLAASMLREVSHIDLTNSTFRSSSGLKHIASFITELSVVLPSVVLQNMSILLPFLDAEPYLLRNSIVSSIANVLVHATSEHQNMNQGGAASSKQNDDDVEEEGQKGSGLHTNESFTKTRDSLLDILIERAHDVSSYTRAAVLKAWVVLCEECAVPLLLIQRAANLAADRLQDKAQLVRKAAMQLLTVMLECNPFMGTLDPTVYESRAAEVEVWLQENPLPEDIAAAEKTKKQMKDGSIAENEHEDNDGESSDDNDDDEEDEGTPENNEIVALRNMRSHKVRELEFFLSASAFIQVLNKDAGSVLESMLKSKSSTDVIEALRFFVQASYFSLPCASQGLRSSWSLAWSTDQSVIDEVCKSFLLVHAYAPGTLDVIGNQNKKNQLGVGKVAMNLINVVAAASNAERTCLEELFSKLVKEGKFDKGLFIALRTTAIKDKRPTIRSSAMLVLAMAASNDASVLGGGTQLKVLAESCLGGHTNGSANWELIRCVCMALKHKTSTTVVKTTQDPWESVTLGYCASILRADWFESSNDDIKHWFAASEQALGCVFALSASPESLCCEIIQAHYTNTLGPDANPCTAASLACFCHLIGGVALHLLVYTERIALKLKKANSLRASSKVNAKEKSSLNDEDEETDSLSAELGLSAEADLEHDQRVASVIDHHIIGNNILAIYEPLLVRIVANEHGLFDDMILREAACLSLCKFMCISIEGCEKNLPLLFTTLANEKLPSVRGNIMVALGDLAFRFPNAIEPWTSHIYRRLKDESGTVRSQTLMVLTHLILNDMVKVKGQVASMVLCLEDPCPRTVDLAKLFFQELGKRGNSPIYNLMPDIVSLLSKDENVSTSTFRNVIPYLMTFITKDKHSESLTEKLCYRFAACNEDLKQIQDVAFCLAQLPINDKALKKLDELLKLYRNHLFDKDVYTSFSLLISKAKKFAKPEMKDALLEYAGKIKSLHEGGDGVISEKEHIQEDEEVESDDIQQDKEDDHTVLGGEGITTTGSTNKSACTESSSSTIKIEALREGNVEKKKIEKSSSRKSDNKNKEKENNPTVTHRNRQSAVQ